MVIGMRCALVVAAMLAVGCKGKESGSSGSASAAAASSAPVLGAGGAIGIQECDDYIAKVNACLAKDSALREQNEAQVKAQTENWKAMAAANEEGATAACKTALASFAIIFPTCK